MKIAVLGTGMVGETVATKLVSLGHDVKMGSRDANNPKATAWAMRVGHGGTHGTFADAAASAEVVFNCTNGEATLAALHAAGARHLAGKPLVDLANRLDFSVRPPVSLARDGGSLAEEIQAAFPDAKVVKSLNTMNCRVMVEPSLVPGDHNVFMSGNDAGAKATLRRLLCELGWRDANILDLGDVTTARGPENLMPLWLRVMALAGGKPFNLHWARGA